MGKSDCHKGVPKERYFKKLVKQLERFIEASRNLSFPSRIKSSSLFFFQQVWMHRSINHEILEIAFSDKARRFVNTDTTDLKLHGFHRKYN